MENQVFLDQVGEGEQVTLLKINRNSPFKRRLVEMGFLKGKIIKVKKFAPLKDPGEYIINDTHISIRRKEAADIEVKRILSEEE